ncbi:MAG: aspartate--tRNA(Asn) ligase [Actinomycetota bacterium]|nr:aspartate--tRNA(Asn) ligase [Actinomycetota bacterium]
MLELERSLVAHLGTNTTGRVRLCGWVAGVAAGVADQPGGARVMLRDRTGTVPLLLCSGSVPRPEEAIEVIGTVAPDEADRGRLAVRVEELVVHGAVLADLPVGPESPLKQRLDWRFLDLRQPRNHLIFEVQTTAERAMRQFWAEHGFLELHSPKFRPNPNRTGRELFSVPYFDRQAYLVQSPQFYKQMAMASGFERVFEIGPVFRANPVATSRHDTEFTSVDVEMSWIDSDEDVMGFEERWLRYVIRAVQSDHGSEIERVFGVAVTVPDLPFPRVPLEEARGIVGEQPPGDLDAAGERSLGQHVARNRGHDFVFVTDYPSMNRPFYHMRRQDGSTLTRGFDLLWKGMEVTTGSQREHRYDRLVAQAEEHGVPLEPIRYYLDCFRFGCPPHGGFGLGLTRMLMALLGQDDVREVTFLHRGPDRLSP